MMYAIAAIDTDDGKTKIFIVDGERMAVIRHNGSGAPFVEQSSAYRLLHAHGEPTDLARIGMDGEILWDLRPAPPPDPEPEPPILNRHDLAVDFALVLTSVGAEPEAMAKDAYARADALIAEGAR